jgi:uncharacterized protein (TIGR03435 family)
VAAIDMTNRLRFLLLAGGVCAAVSLAAQDDGRTAALRFDVVSVRENTGGDLSITSPDQPSDGFRRVNLPLTYYVTYAFDVPQPTRMAGMPEWALSVRYDVVAKAARQISEEERRAMVRDLLVSRFHLKVHRESRQQAVYVLTAARQDRRLGPGVKARPECATEKCDAGGTGRPDGVEVRAIPMQRFANLLSNLLRQLVIDETAIAGAYDISASWRPDAASSDASEVRPSMFTALEEQLGLKLKSERRPVDVLVIDTIERASPD